MYKIKYLLAILLYTNSLTPSIQEQFNRQHAIILIPLATAVLILFSFSILKNRIKNHCCLALKDLNPTFLNHLPKIFSDFIDYTEENKTELATSTWELCEQYLINETNPNISCSFRDSKKTNIIETNKIQSHNYFILLYYTCLKGDIKKTQFLLNLKYINIKNLGIKPLEIACSYRQSGCVQVLLNAGFYSKNTIYKMLYETITFNNPQYDFNQELNQELIEKELATIYVLANSGIDINNQQELYPNNTALHCILVSPFYHTFMPKIIPYAISTLLDLGAKPSIKNKQGKTAIEYTTDQQTQDMFNKNSKYKQEFDKQNFKLKRSIQIQSCAIPTIRKLNTLPTKKSTDTTEHLAYRYVQNRQINRNQKRISTKRSGS